MEGGHSSRRLGSDQEGGDWWQCGRVCGAGGMGEPVALVAFAKARAVVIAKTGERFLRTIEYQYEHQHRLNTLGKMQSDLSRSQLLRTLSSSDLNNDGVCCAKTIQVVTS